MKLLSQEDYNKYLMSKHGHDYNEGRYTRLNEEIDMHKPDTSWHSVLVATVSIIAAGFLIFAVTTLISFEW
jgi:hypothetical protein